MKTELTTDVQVWNALQEPSCDVIELGRPVEYGNKLVLIGGCVTYKSSGRKTVIDFKKCRYYAETPEPKWYDHLKDGVQMLVRVMPRDNKVFLASDYHKNSDSVFIDGYGRKGIEFVTPLTKTEIVTFMELAPEELKTARPSLYLV
jgi:hypothetical protein